MPMTPETIFNRTGSDDFPLHLKAMVTGPPKSGKTTLLGTVPNIVIADTEPHANNLQSIAHLNLPYVTINSLDDLQRLRFVLSDTSMREKAAEQLNLPAIEAVAIDTLDTLQGIMKKERMRDMRQTQFQRDDWAWIKAEMEAIVEAFTALPMHVFFIVHTKTKEIGKGDDGRTIVLPSLEGSIAESIAGMVGYSLLAFRKQEIRPDGSKYTKYWLRAEGDETYEFLGNRTAGRLPDVIEPDFNQILEAVKAGRPQAQPEAVQMPTIQTTVGTEAAQSPGQPEVTPPTRPSDDEPMNPAALQHLKKVYTALKQPFPEDTLRSLSIGTARTIVQTWQAIQRDHSEGKGPKDVSPESLMHTYLEGQGWLGGEAEATTAPKAVEPKVDGTIEQVLAYAGEDLAKVQEAFDLEMSKPQQRSSLIDTLVKRGAKVPTPVEDQFDKAPEEVTVTPAATVVDDTSTEEAVELVEEVLGGEVVSDESTEARPCAECGKAVDDLDIARLSSTRFDRWLCVADYIAETKKPRVSA